MNDCKPTRLLVYLSFILMSFLALHTTIFIINFQSSTLAIEMNIESESNDNIEENENNEVINQIESFHILQTSHSDFLKFSFNYHGLYHSVDNPPPEL